MAIKRVQGFTLIEMLIVLTIAGALLASSVLSARTWLQGNRVIKVKSTLSEMLIRTRALALQNRSSTTDQTSVAAYLRYNNTTRVLTLCSGSGACPQPFWQQTLPAGVTLNYAADNNGAVQGAFVCFALNNRGIPMTRALGDGTNCSGTPAIAFALDGVTQTDWRANF